MPAFGRVAVLGLGLLGGSVALAAKRRGVAACVAGATRRREVLETADAAGALDVGGDYEEAARGAEIVVLATPVFAMADVVRAVAPVLSPGTLVTDVGSVKGALCDTLPGILPRGVHYVGAHPMAGSHRQGFAHASAELFEDAPCIVVDGPDAGAARRVAEFWSALGARVVRREAAAHDREVAWVSHVPHVLAFAFARALAEAPPSAGELAGPGFRDFTRIAHGDPEMWSDIFTANHKALAAPLQALRRALDDLERAIESADADAVHRGLAAARDTLGRRFPARPRRRNSIQYE